MKPPAEFRDAVMRLSSLRGFPIQKEGQEALVDAFFESVRLENLARAVSYFVDDYGGGCPVSGDIRAAARNNDWGVKRGIAYCKRCDNTGWQEVKKGIYTGVMPCGCEKGELRKSGYGEAVANNKKLGRSPAPRMTKQDYADLARTPEVKALAEEFDMKPEEVW